MASLDNVRHCLSVSRHLRAAKRIGQDSQPKDGTIPFARSLGFAANARHQSHVRDGLLLAPIVCDRLGVSKDGQGIMSQGDCVMCRNIKTLHNFEPPATDDEIHASALQFVRKLSGFARPSKANETAFNQAVDDVTQAAHRLLAALVTNALPRDREVEAAKAKARAADRFRSDADAR
jgi:hypothetical protein